MAKPLTTTWHGVDHADIRYIHAMGFDRVTYQPLELEQRVDNYRAENGLGTVSVPRPNEFMARTATHRCFFGATAEEALTAARASIRAQNGLSG